MSNLWLSIHCLKGPCRAIFSVFHCVLFCELLFQLQCETVGLRCNASQIGLRILCQPQWFLEAHQLWDNIPTGWPTNPSRQSVSPLESWAFIMKRSQKWENKDHRSLKIKKELSLKKYRIFGLSLGRKLIRCQLLQLNVIHCMGTSTASSSASAMHLFNWITDNIQSKTHWQRVIMQYVTLDFLTCRLRDKKNAFHKIWKPFWHIWI